jgi:hypothetical protein
MSAEKKMLHSGSAEQPQDGWKRFHFVTILGSRADAVRYMVYLSPDLGSSSLSIIRMIKSRRMKWAGHVARMGAKRTENRILVGKPEGKRPLGRTRRRWVDKIKMDLREIGWDVMDWIDLAQDRDHWRALVNTVMNLWVPQNAGKFLSSS